MSDRVVGACRSMIYSVKRRSSTYAVCAAFLLLFVAGCGYTPSLEPLPCAEGLTAEDVDRYATWRAEWVSVEGREVFVELTFREVETPTLAFAGDPVLGGATLVEQLFEDRDHSFTCSVDEGVTEVTIAVPIQCDTVESTIQLYMNVSDEPTLGGWVPVHETE